MKAVVLLVQANGCAPAEAAIAQLAQAKQQYDKQGIAVFMLNPTRTSRANVARETTRLGTSIPVLLDTTQLIAGSLQATRAGEMLVIDTKSWTLAYRGGAAQAAVAVDAVLGGGTVSVASTPASGCNNPLPELEHRAEHAQISYRQTIAPILAASCVSCHRQLGAEQSQPRPQQTGILGRADLAGNAVRRRALPIRGRKPPNRRAPHAGPWAEIATIFFTSRSAGSRVR
jgi:hypothetical protein